MTYFLDFLFLMILFLPTFISNAIPVIIKNIYPFSQYKKPICEKYLGKNKTYRGFISGIIFGILTSLLVYGCFSIFDFSWNKEYFNIIPNIGIAIFAGFLQGFGALFGDMVKSFFKRKLGKKPGTAWPFWDGVDYILGSILFFSILFIPTSIFDSLFLIFIGPLSSLLANTIAYFIGWKDVRY